MARRVIRATLSSHEDQIDAGARGEGGKHGGRTVLDQPFLDVGVGGRNGRPAAITSRPAILTRPPHWSSRDGNA